MADQNITELPIKTNTGVANTDYMLGIDASEGYQILVRDVAKYIVENYNGSTLAGSAQTPKSAIDTLNSNTTDILHRLTGWGAYNESVRNFDTAPTESLCGLWWINLGDSGVTGTKPVSTGQGVLIILRQSTTIYRQTYMGLTSGGYEGSWCRYYNTNDSSWTAWHMVAPDAFPNLTNSTILEYVRSLISSGRREGHFLTTTGVTDTPTSSTGWHVWFTVNTGSGTVILWARSNSSSDLTNGTIYTSYILSATTVLTWTQQPSRAEVDTLNSNKVGLYKTATTTASSGSLANICDASGFYLFTVSYDTDPSAYLFTILYKADSANPIAVARWNNKIAITTVNTGGTIALKYDDAVTAGLVGKAYKLS